VRKSAAAMVVQSRVGETFDAVVTGASNKGTYVRVVSPPIEGKLMTPRPGLDVGDRLRVRLSGVNIDRGFIDFQRHSEERSTDPRRRSGFRPDRVQQKAAAGALSSRRQRSVRPPLLCFSVFTVPPSSLLVVTRPGGDHSTRSARR
jgi:hypothetical protein